MIPALSESKLKLGYWILCSARALLPKGALARGEGIVGYPSLRTSNLSTAMPGAQDADLLASFQARFDALLKDSKERA